jgi:hypothetical protein
MRELVRLTTDHYIHADCQVWDVRELAIHAPTRVDEDLYGCSAVGEWEMYSGGNRLKQSKLNPKKPSSKRE